MVPLFLESILKYFNNLSKLVELMIINMGKGMNLRGAEVDAEKQRQAKRRRIRGGYFSWTW
jgi:hypothetical protein